MAVLPQQPRVVLAVGSSVGLGELQPLLQAGSRGRGAQFLLLAGGHWLCQGALLHRVQAVGADAGPRGGVEALGLQPEFHQVLHPAQLHELDEVREGYTVLQDLFKGLGKA